jgi:hypothetical protein
MSAREASPRAYAHQHAAQGVALLAHAVNACKRPDACYRYGVREQRRFLRIARELFALIEEGEIVPIAPQCAPTDAEHNQAFQRFIAALAVAPTKAKRTRAK